MAGDPLGFSKHTATILRGLGAASLIPECERRNISTDTLHALTKEDFIKLGANEKKAEELKRALSFAKRVSKDPHLTPNDRWQDFSLITKNGQEQLSLLEAYLAYMRLRLSNHRHNCYIDPDKPLTASDILPLAVKATIQEVEELATVVSELRTQVSNTLLQQGGEKRRNSWSLYSHFILLISGLGIAGVAMLRVLPIYTMSACGRNICK